MVNIFQLIGDLLHLLSFIIIIYKIQRDAKCTGVSAKTQEIYLIVFCTLYMDLFFTFISFYNTIMKIINIFKIHQGSNKRFTSAKSSLQYDLIFSALFGCNIQV